MAKYLITGGCGFIGSQLTKKLIEEGHEVIIVDDLSNGTIIHPQAIFVQQDITQFDSIHNLFFDIDGCFHLAAIPTVVMNIEQWFDVHAINLDGSLNVFKAAIEAGKIPVVYASSCGVYGNTEQLPLEEEQFIKPLCSYGCDKLSTELNAYFLARDYQLPSMGLRFFNVYGPYQQESSPYSGVITHFITTILANKPLTIFGDGKQTRDFVFVDDVVDNLIHAMRTLKQGAHVVNICTGHKTSINRLVKLLSKLLNQHSIKEYQPARQADVKDSYGSQEKMSAYGFDIKHDMQQGLMKTINYFSLLQSGSDETMKTTGLPWIREHKELVGFANLSLVRDKIQNIIQCHSFHQMAILIINIDDFRIVNDLMGARIGDLTLCKVVEKIMGNFRGDDIFARKYGDEFILILLNHSPEEVNKIIKNIFSELSQPFIIDTHEICITVSIGVSLWSEDAENADDLLAYAQLALNRVKENGKNNYQFYTHTYGAKTHHIQKMQNNLMHALTHNELYICYQAQIEISSKQIIGFEALLRWNNPQLGLIYPADFIPIAEKTGQIIPIGNWVLHRACLEAASWQKAGKSLQISVNVSVSQLQDCYGYPNNHFLHSVQQALKQTSLKPELLELEITEGTLMQMNDATFSCIEKLKKLGVRIACDDFGIGYSSYSRILLLPLNTIKIDQSLIMDISKNLINATAIIGGVITMGRQLGIKIIAEGVETREQLDVLQNLGCEVIQGNYFSKPVLPEKLKALLKHHF